MSKILFIIGHPDLANDSVVTKEVLPPPRGVFGIFEEILL